MKTKLVNENFKSDWVKNLLISRGVDGGRLEEFLHPTWENISDPSNLDNCEAAAKRILKAVEDNEHIGLVIDSDVDGITSSTIIYSYLHDIKPELEITYFFHDGKNITALEPDDIRKIYDSLCQVQVTGQGEASRWMDQWSVTIFYTPEGSSFQSDIRFGFREGVLTVNDEAYAVEGLEEVLNSFDWDEMAVIAEMIS